MNKRKRAENIFEAVIRYKEFQRLLEGTLPFLVYRTDTGVVLARNIYGFEAAKNKASEVRKKYGLKFEQVKFKQDRSTQQKSHSTSPARRMDYAPRYNPSKRGRFKGYYDAKGNFHDIS